MRFLILNALCLYLELWFLLRQEAHFQKNHANKQKKWCPNVENAIKTMSDTSKCDQHSVAYMKMSSKRCRIHGSSRPRKPPVAIIHIFARIFEVQLGGHGGDKRGKGRTTER